ncbi:hypothetical protein RhiJN_17174 [Ceratobasidium sp. AG-Ba]|nr:hypothetical protein RhiJN_17174 [Ceratobasidium sp. AG-Ba]
MSQFSRPPRIQGQDLSSLGSETNTFGIEQALSNWKIWRGTLSSAVQGYITASAALSTACAKPLTQPSRRRAIEQALAAIDAELESLISERHALEQANLSLMSTRNASTLLSPIHALPPEIITRVFTFVHSFYGLGNPQLIPAAHSLAGVSSYWRKIAISMRLLWSYIRLSSSSKNYEHSQLLLERSSGHPLYAYVVADDEDRAKNRLYEDDIYPRLQFIDKAGPQIDIMNVVLLADYTEPVEKALVRWFNTDSNQSRKTLCASRPLHEGPIPVEWDWDIFLDPAYDSTLKSIDKLSLDDIFIPWDSCVYHGLTHLRLSFGENSALEVTILELADILRACPELETLKIQGGLVVTSPDGWDASTVVSLSRLVTLSLIELPHESYRALLPVLSVSSGQRNLCVRLDIHSFRDMADVIQNFVRRSPIKTFVSDDSTTENGLEWPLSLVPLMPSFENMVLVRYGALDQSIMDRLASDMSSGDNEEQPSTRRQPILPHLYLVANDLGSRQDYIHTIISLYGVQTLHLDNCILFAPPSLQSHGMAEVEARLKASFPNLACIVGKKDTTADWPCRKSSILK